MRIHEHHNLLVLKETSKAQQEGEPDVTYDYLATSEEARSLLLINRVLYWLDIVKHIPDTTTRLIRHYLEDDDLSITDRHTMAANVVNQYLWERVYFVTDTKPVHALKED